MTRPRSYQLNNPSIKLTSVTFPALPAIDAASASTATSLIAPQTATGSFTGQLALPARLTSTVNAVITAAEGDTFSIALDGGSATIVTLQSSDVWTTNQTTPSLIASRINATGGLNGVASVDSTGHLALISLTTGTSSQVTVTAGTISLVTIGFSGTSSATGSNAVDSVVTVSEDGKGGYAFLSSSDGNPVIANASRLFRLKTTGGEYVSNVVPNSPVFARTTKSGSDLVATFYQRVYGNGPLTSSKSKFPTINVGDSLTIGIKDNVTGFVSDTITLTGSTYANAVAVTTAINTAWGVRRTGVAVTQKSAPFYVSGTLNYKVDGVAQTTVIFDGSERTAAQVATKINSHGTTSGDTVLISSTTTTGSGSTIDILATSSHEVLEALGLSVGVYSGSLLASTAGTEIVLTPPCPSSTITISGGPGVPEKYGFASADTASSVREIAVGWPQVPDNDALIVAKLTEYMEFGQIPSTADESNELASLQSLTPFMSPDELVGIRKSGQLVSRTTTGVLESGGSLQYDSGSIGAVTFPATDSSASSANPRPAMVMKVIDNDVTPILEGYKADGSVRILSNDLSDVTSIALTSNASYDRNTDQWKADDISAPASLVQLEKEQFIVKSKATTASAWADNGWTKVVSAGKTTGLTGVDQDLSLFGATTALRGVDSSLKISDSNIDNDGTQQYINVSDADAGLGLRIGNVVKNNSNSLLKSVNGRAYISIGDGTDTFGDFNGASALQSALNFITSGSISSATIYIKAGIYQASTKMVCNGSHIAIIGESRDSCIINGPTNNDITFEMAPTTCKTLIIQNVTINSSASSKALSLSNIDLTLLDSTVGGIYASIAAAFNRDKWIYVENSKVFSARDINKAALHLYNDGGGFTFNGVTKVPKVSINGSEINCYPAADSFRCLLVECKNFTSSPTFTQYWFSNIEFSRCTFYLSYGTPTTVGNTLINTGLVELMPNNDARLHDGLVVENLSYSNCIINGVQSTYNSILALSSDLTTSTPTSSSNYGYVKNLAFNESSFTVFLSPLTSTYTTASFVVGSGARSVSITNCAWVYENYTLGCFGTYPTWFSTYDLGGSSTYQADIAFAVESLYIDGFTIINIPRLTNRSGKKGHLLDFRAIRNVDIKNVTAKFVDGGSAPLPAGRIYSADVEQPELVKFNNINLIGPASTSSSFTNDDAFIFSQNSTFEIFNSRISGFTYSSHNPTEKGIRWEPLNDGYLCKIMSNVITGPTYGVSCASNLVGSVIISGNDISGSSGSGAYPSKGVDVYFENSAADDTSVIITNNRITISGAEYQYLSPPTTTNGVNCSAGIWVGMLVDYNTGCPVLTISNNDIATTNLTNSGSYEVPGIFVAPTLGSNAGSTVNCSIINNNCKTQLWSPPSGYSTGSIQIMKFTHPNWLPIDSSYAPASLPSSNCETGFEVDSGTYALSNYLFSDNDKMVKNNATLANGSVPGA